MSRKIGNFAVWKDVSLGTNEIKLHGSFFEKNGKLQEGHHIVKIKTKGNKRIYLNGISGSKKKSEVYMHSDLIKRLNINVHERVEISTCGLIDHVIQILTLRNLSKAFQSIVLVLSIVLVILLVKVPFLYITWMIISFFIIFTFLVILSCILRRFYLKT